MRHVYNWRAIGIRRRLGLFPYSYFRSDMDFYPGLKGSSRRTMLSIMRPDIYRPGYLAGNKN